MDNVGVGLGLDFGLVLVPEVILPVPSCEVGMMNARASCEGASAGEVQPDNVISLKKSA